MQSILACGEKYTYAQGRYTTTVDYCLIDSGYAHLINSCTTLPPMALNLSDHLPISISLDTSTGPIFEFDNLNKLNWQLAVEKSYAKDYSVSVSAFLSEITARSVPQNIKSLDREISEICCFLCNTAQELIPVVTEKRKRKLSIMMRF